MTIQLRQLLTEASKEQLALEFLSNVIRNGPYAGKVYLCGGAVRDAVMGKSVKDIDIVITEPDGGIAFSEWITKELGSYKEGANPIIFPRFGTAKFNLRGVKVGTIDLSDVDIEAVMTRGETYTHGSRKPEVNYADLAEDAKRRDFTVNDLYKDLTTGEIIDPTGRGIDDIRRGIIRTPIDANLTFKDDPLRMLRAVRFTCKYDWKMTKNVLQALKQNAEALKHISRERIQDEFNKMMMTNNPDIAMKIMSRTGLLRQFLPEFDELRGVKQNMYHDDDVFGHTLGALRETPRDLKARLSAVFHDIGKPSTISTDKFGRIHFYDHEDVGAEMAGEIMHRMAYSNDIIRSVQNIVQHHMRLKAGGSDGSKIGDRTLRRFAAELGDDLDSAWAMMQGDNMSHADGHTAPNQIANYRERIKQLIQSAPQKPNLPINGRDIMQTFDLQPGPHLKPILKAVEDAWFEDPTISRENALAIAKTAYDSLQGNTPSGEEDILNKRITNPETGNSILVRTALQYEPTHPVRRAADTMMRKSKGS